MAFLSVLLSGVEVGQIELQDEAVRTVLSTGGQTTYWDQAGLTIELGCADPIPLTISLHADI